MSIGSVPLRAVVNDTRREWQRRWEDADPATRTRIQVTVVALAVLVAFHYSLMTLVENLDVNTPLAYIGLVPAIALGIAAVQRRPVKREPAIHDRQLDYIIGLPLIAGALAIEMIVPRHLNTMFWLWRVDLLGLPLFVAGTVALIFGTRVLWRQKFAIAYLLLAWPLPYTDLFNRLLGSFTNMTLSALRHIVAVVPVAHYLGGSDGSLFQITHAGHQFQLSVVSACSGVDGIVGFALVGVAFGAVVRGPRIRKLVWLVGGMLLLWLINLGRLVLVFWAGQQFGESFAINVLHPFIGLVTFNIGVLLMVLALAPFGLRIGWTPPEEAPIDRAVGPHKVPVAVPRVFAAVTVVTVAALLLGINNSSLSKYDLVANAVGEPKLASYSLDPATPLGWSATFTSDYTWARSYFGNSSTWYRFTYAPVSGGGGDLHATVPVTADVINSADLSSFSAYGVEACYRFHGYSLKDIAQFSLGGGITGQAMSFQTTGDGADWSIVWWIWPVVSGTSTRYERVILYIQNTLGTIVTGPAVPGLVNVQGGLSESNGADRRLIAERAFLVQFGREIVQGQAKIVVGSEQRGLTEQLALADAPLPPGASTAGKSDSAKLERERANSYRLRHSHAQTANAAP